MNKQPDFTVIRQYAQEIREILGDDDDEVTFWDSLDGMTDATDILDALLFQDQQTLALVEANKVLVSQIRARSDRLSMRSQRIRETLGKVLDAAGMKKAERPIATVSRRAGSLSVSITDEASIPSQLCTVKTVTAPDKKAIRAQIEAGVDVPGACLERGPDGVTVRAS